MSNIRYLQSDIRWKDTRLGTGDYTIGNAGCLLCSTAVACTMLGYPETPDSLNSKLVAINGFDASLIKLGFVPMAVSGMKYLNYVKCPDDAAPMELINSNMDAGNVVIVKIDSDPNTVGVQDHWVVLESRKEGEYIIIDPLPDTWTGNTAHLLSHYSPGRSRSCDFDVSQFCND